MRKLLVCSLVVIFGLMTGQAMAQDYDIDVVSPVPLETLAPGQTVTVDVYMANCPGAADAGVVELCATGPITMTSMNRYLTDGSEGGLVGPWDPAIGFITPNGSKCTFAYVGNLGNVSPDGEGRMILVQAEFTCTGDGTAEIKADMPVGGGNFWSPVPPWPDDQENDANIGPETLAVAQECACTSDLDCAPGPDEFCTVPPNQTCVDCQCVGGDPLPCDDGNICTLDPCDEDTDTCLEKSCDPAQIPNATAPCCSDPICSENPICGAEVTLIKEDGYYQPPAGEDVVTIKNHICLDNPSDLVGGIQFDICDSPDCLTCIDCELTERTTMFDCVVIELENGCCRVIMFCKNPGCAINPGLCDIVTVVMQTKEGAPEECGEICIEESFENIVASDYDGYLLASAGISGELCPVVCGDVCPPGSGGDANDCGNGVVDIYDIMCEVDFALTATTPNTCQAPRADVPTGTPPYCTAPDGSINILDIMVIIDMALDRQDCCSFYYQGIIY